MADYQAPTNDFQSRPLEVTEVLSRIFGNARKSDVIPPRPVDAAHWWIAHQEPANEKTERVEQVTTRAGETGWRTPYIDRVSYTAKVFLSLDAPHQAFVIDKIERGIPWRGDDIRMFLMICEQHELMQRDRNAYVCNASAVLSEVKGAA